MKRVSIYRNGDRGDIEILEKDHPSLTVSVKDQWLMVSDVEGILEIIPMSEIMRVSRS